MKPLLAKISGAMGWEQRAPSLILSGFVDSLLQKFENSRAGLSDQMLRGGEEETGRFFTELYQKELPRLASALEIHEQHLPLESRKRFYQEVDDLIRKVVIPAYSRLATRFTPRERNDFYLVRDPLHLFERAGWCVGGMLLGAFVVWAPFIPLWSKEWVLPFAIAGLILPNLRRLFAMKRYESELNRLVDKADHEIDRVEMAYLTSTDALTAPVESSDLQKGEGGEVAEQSEARTQSEETALESQHDEHKRRQSIETTDRRRGGA